jgi:hypothetical protein
MSFYFQITFSNTVGKFDLDVTTFQMAVLFAWNQRPRDKISYENLRLASELPDPELRKTLWVRSHQAEVRVAIKCKNLADHVFFIFSRSLLLLSRK